MKTEHNFVGFLSPSTYVNLNIRNALLQIKRR